MSNRPECQFSVRTLLIGMVLSCLTLGGMRALAAWKWETHPSLPFAQRQAIYLELNQCKDPHAAIPWVAADHKLPVEVVERIFREGRTQMWPDEPPRVRPKARSPAS